MYPLFLDAVSKRALSPSCYKAGLRTLALRCPGARYLDSSSRLIDTNTVVVRLLPLGQMLGTTRRVLWRLSSSRTRM